jgi:hypothetical protein
MNKRYYDSSIIAAYMAKEFGAVIVDDKGVTFRLAEIIHDSFFGGYDGKFYLHPDSLSLLEPVVGDLYEVDVTCDVPMLNEKYELIGYKSRSSPFAEHMRVPVSRNLNGEFLRIIQRNGKPFFWPLEESEGA